MFKVQGTLAVLETGAGIPNLQVVLYDLDNRSGNVTAAPAADVKAGTNPDPAWEVISGDRLGSVLSDARGGFSLEFAAQDFQALDKEARPDVLLIVLAPADADTKQPFSAPVAQRVLFMTRDVRINAARLESYFIRIPKAKLDRFKIHVPAAATIAEGLSAATKAGRNLQSAVTTALHAKFAPLAADLARTRQAFSTFTLGRRANGTRDGRVWLQPGEALAAKQNTLIQERVNAIAIREADRTRGFTMRVPAQTLREWGVVVADGAATASGVVAHRKLLAWYRSRRQGVALKAGQSAMQSYCRQQEARQKFDDTVARCSADHEEPAPKPPESAGSGDIQARVRDQISTVTTPEQHLSYGVDRPGGALSAVIHTGAADVTAYHDFQEIQIAFEHIWSESADRSLQPFLLGAYREMVRYQNRVSGAAEFPDVGSVDDMRDLYNEFRGLQRMVAQASEPPAEETDAGVPVPSAVRTLLPALTQEQWSAMAEGDRTHLIELADEFMRRKDYDTAEEIAAVALSFGAYAADNEAKLSAIRSEAQTMLVAAQRAARERAQQRRPAGRGPRPASSATEGTRLSDLMAELDERLNEPYRFDVFAPDSTNYGVMLTYRQTWEPKDYQVGDLISTVPLAPKEVRRYEAKQVVRRNRLQKELEDIQTSRSSESQDTSRADAEIVRQARNRTSFEQTANATINVGMFQGEFGTRFGIEAEKSSSDTKRNFREAVAKAAEEYKRQRRLEIETTDTTEMENTSGGEISNPNDEITVTYMFYELQRQFLVSERMQSLTPVVLVAREVPSPDEVDVDWLLAHDWIIRRVLLDETQNAALNYLSGSIAGDELALEALRESMRRQVELVEELTRKERMQTDLSQQAFNELKRLMSSARSPDDAEKMKEIGLAMVFGPFALAGGNGDDRAAEKREEIAKLALERADKSKTEASAKLTREVTAMQEAVERYTRALQTHFDRMASIARLRIHVKENILHYMQAIWDHEPGDQRFFALYNLEVPWIEERDLDIEVRVSGRRLAPHEIMRESDRTLGEWYEITGRLPLGSGLAGGTPSLRRSQRTLSDIANLDQLLGYKGNYQIFPLKETSYLHDYMMQDYLDPATGALRDPDSAAGATTDEILRYVCCLSRHDPERLAAERESLQALIESRAASPEQEKQLIVVPSKSLYIEALPGKHPIMEDFKLTHRALDVKKVQAEVRSLELDNLRRAARVLAGEFDDPDTERKVIIKEAATPVIVPTEG